MSRPLRIAMVGSRGIPASYSGVETAVEQLARCFGDAGHEVTVYCRATSAAQPERHAGARLVHLPTVRAKHLDTLAHTALSTGHLVLLGRPDVAIYSIAGNAPVVPLARLAGVPALLQIDGLDSERAKWSAPARAYLRLAERLAPAAATIAITDSATVADHYEARFGRRPPVVTYGADLPDPGGAEWCARLGVTPGRFLLFVGRLEPENNAHVLVEAHASLPQGSRWPLVVVGDAPYAGRYIAELKAAAGADVRFPGYVFGDGYRELVHRCGVMCVPPEVGGTHPVIVEGMAAGAALLVSDHAPNLEVVGDAAAVFPLEGGATALAGALAALVADPGRCRELGARAAARARANHSWERAAAQYLALCRAAIARAGHGR